MQQRSESDAGSTDQDDCELIVDTDNLSWRSILMAIPLSEQVFISGGAATWLTERATFGTDPEWTPDDIDVFVCLRDNLFVTLVNALLLRHIDTNGARVKRRNGIIDVQTTNRPHLSFIRCDVNVHPRAIVSQFDINICQPIAIRDDGKIVVRMTGEVHAAIRERHMRCTITKKNPTFTYPFARTLNRLSKYQTRGYDLVSLTFNSSIHRDFPERESWLHADEFRSLCDAFLC